MNNKYVSKTMHLIFFLYRMFINMVICTCSIFMEKTVNKIPDKDGWVETPQSYIYNMHNHKLQVKSPVLQLQEYLHRREPCSVYNLRAIKPWQMLPKCRPFLKNKNKSKNLPFSPFLFHLCVEEIEIFYALSFSTTFIYIYIIIEI